MFQIKAEMEGCLDFLQKVYGIFNFTFTLNLSTRPEKYLGEIEVWDAAEKVYCKLNIILVECFTMRPLQEIIVMGRL